MAALFRAALILAALTLATSTAAQSAYVVDGDTIKIDGTTYRLWGIDAPETKQACTDGWMSGQAASSYMRSLVEGRKVECEKKDVDRYGRTVALCRADSRDLGASMVEAGMAWAFVRYSRAYVDQEKRARAEYLGVHGHACELAWNWRAHRR